MGCRILAGKLDGGNGREAAVFYCSTTGIAFGPVFEGLNDPGELSDPHDEAEAFAKWLESHPVEVARFDRGGPYKGRYEMTTDPREIPERKLLDLYKQWHEEVDAALTA